MRESAKSKLESLKNDIKEYVTAMRARRTIEHSRTPATATKNGVTGLCTIQINELITIVKTAKALGKDIQLDATVDSLVVLLVDTVIPYPISFYS